MSFLENRKKDINVDAKVIGTVRMFLFAVMVSGLILLAGCMGGAKSIIPSEVPEAFPGYLQGYLPLNAVPDSHALLPAPPARDSAAFAADQEAFRKTRALKNSPRWSWAIRDANLHFPQALGFFSCALDVSLTEESMPNLHMLLRRTLTDAGYSTLAAKNHYKRIRPFVVNNETSCTPDKDKELAKEGSYPSGHTSVGWAWALILAEIAPDRADAILQRGYAFGESRVICGVHWQSDVEAGRIMGAAVVAKLHSDPVFRAQMKAAQKELAAARAKGLVSTNNCREEAAVLAY